MRYTRKVSALRCARIEERKWEKKSEGKDGKRKNKKIRKVKK
jgi:hypothetical protein